jgi:hypothetical protein
MNSKSTLIGIKILHTIIWAFFNVTMFYLIFAVIINKIDMVVWSGIAIIALEGIVLLVFKMKCPLTLIAGRYTNSRQPNFDIYLPNWLALHNKLIYTSIFVITMCGLAYRIAANSPHG